WLRRWPARPARPWSAAATARPHSRSSAWPTRSRTCPPAAARRSSCSRARSCRGWRRSTMPDRRPYIAGNWKMFKTIAEAKAFVEEMRPLVEGVDTVDIGLCVPYTALAATVEACEGSRIVVCAQNMHQEPEGAYTGEVSAPMLNEIGVRGVVLGHSERRQYFGETDRALQEKLPAALAAGLEPILCVGETEEGRG